MSDEGGKLIRFPVEVRRARIEAEQRGTEQQPCATTPWYWGPPGSLYVHAAPAGVTVSPSSET